MAILLERAGPIDVKTVDLCLDGFRNAIAVVGVFGMDMEKDAFVSSLSKFTLLNSITDMKKKNIECIRVLLAIAASEGSNLGSQWTWVRLLSPRMDSCSCVCSYSYVLAGTEKEDASTCIR